MREPSDPVPPAETPPSEPPPTEPPPSEPPPTTPPATDPSPEPTPPTTPPTGPSEPTGSPDRRGEVAVDDTTWETWWETNRFEFLTPRFVTPTLTPRPDRALAVDAAMLRAKVWPLLLRQRDSSDVMVRTATLVTIGRVGATLPDLSVQARGILLEAVGDHDRRVARAAIRGLVHVAEPALAPPLHLGAASKNHAHDVRGFLTLALPSNGSNASDALLSSLWKGDEGGNFEITTLAALAHTTGPAGDALLRTVAADGDARPELRATAFWSLARRGVEDAPALLLRALDDKNVHVRRAATMSLGVLEWRTPAEAAIESLRTEAEGRERAPADLADRLRLLASLVEAQSVPRDERVRTVTKRLARVLERDRDRFTRSMAAISLGRIARQVESPLAVSVLERELARDRHAQREFSLLALALARAPSAGEAAVAALQRKNSAPTTRGASAIALGLLGQPSADAALLKTLEGDPHPTVRGYAAVGLGMIGSEASGRPLRDFAESARTPDAVGWGSMALALLGRREDTRLLVARLAHGTNNVIGWNIVHALRMGGDRAAVEPLLAIAGDSRSQVQELGILALGYVAARDPYPARLRMSRGYDYTLRHLTLDAYYFTL